MEKCRLPAEHVLRTTGTSPEKGKQGECQDNAFDAWCADNAFAIICQNFSLIRAATSGHWWQSADRSWLVQIGLPHKLTLRWSALRGYASR